MTDFPLKSWEREGAGSRDETRLVMIWWLLTQAKSRWLHGICHAILLLVHTFKIIDEKIARSFTLCALIFTRTNNENSLQINFKGVN